MNKWDIYNCATYVGSELSILERVIQCYIDIPPQEFDVCADLNHQHMSVEQLGCVGRTLARSPLLPRPAFRTPSLPLTTCRHRDRNRDMYRAMDRHRDRNRDIGRDEGRDKQRQTGTCTWTRTDRARFCFIDRKRSRKRKICAEVDRHRQRYR